MTRRINAAGLSLVKQWEGRKLLAYYDVAGVLTIGYGSTGSHVKPGMRISEAEAERLLKDDLDRFEKAVAAKVRVPLNDNQFAALVAFSFNVGIGAFQGSTLLRKLNAGDYGAVPGELLKWTKATVKGRKVTIKGLVNRRKAEGALWRSGAASAPIPQPKPETPSVKPAGGIWAAIIKAIVAFIRGGK